MNGYGIEKSRQNKEGGEGLFFCNAIIIVIIIIINTVCGAIATLENVSRSAGFIGYEGLQADASIVSSGVAKVDANTTRGVLAAGRDGRGDMLRVLNTPILLCCTYLHHRRYSRILWRAYADARL